MKLLNLSNGALASEARADKSLVSRWARGMATPRGPYRAVLTDIVRARVPGFTQLSWDLPLDDFARLLGGGESPSEALAAPPVTPPVDAKGSGAPAEPAAADADSPPAPIPRSGRRLLPYASALILLLAVAGVFLLRHSAPQPSSATPAGAAPPSIAVLPFENMSGDPAKNYFSDGFAEELLNELANIPGLRVASRTDSFALRGRGLDTAEIGRKLHVTTVLEGSIREDGKRVRITAQLINAATGFHIWSQEYDRDLTDVLKLQDEIGRAIAGALSQRLLAGAVRSPAPQIDPDAYRKYLQALSAFYVGTPADAQRSVKLLQEVTASAPQFADAFAQLGMSLEALADHDRSLNIDRPAGDAFARALRIDPDNRRAIGAYPYLLFKQWRWQEGVDATRRAARHADDASNRALALMYTMFDLSERTAVIEQRLVASRPTDWWQHMFLTDAFLRVGRYAEASERSHAAEQLAASPYVLSDQCIALAMLGDLDGARRYEARLKPATPGGVLSSSGAYCSEMIAVRRHDLGALRELADTLARQFSPASEIGAQQVGEVFQQVGDYDRAMAWYERAFAAREPTLFAQGAARAEQLTPEGRALPNDPRWRALMQRPAARDWLAVRKQLAAEPMPAQ